MTRCCECRRELTKADFAAGQLRKAKEKRTCRRCCTATEMRRDKRLRNCSTPLIGDGGEMPESDAAAELDRLVSARRDGARACSHGLYRQALDTFSKAADSAQVLRPVCPASLQLECRSAEVEALRGRGAALHELALPGEARACWQQALKLLKALRERSDPVREPGTPASDPSSRGGEHSAADSAGDGGADDGGDDPVMMRTGSSSDYRSARPVTLCDQRESQRMEAWLLAATGHAALEDCDPQAADQSFALAVECADGCGHATIALDALIGRAKALRRAGNACTELQCLKAAVPRLERDGPPRRLCSTLLSMAECQEHRGDYQAAVGCWQRVLGLSRETGSPDDESVALACLANTCDSLGDSDQCAHYTQQLVKQQQHFGRDLKVRQCRWCREPFDEGAGGRRILQPCLHVFHDSCISNTGGQEAQGIPHVMSRCPTCNL